jgi:hypothetical protein
MDNMWHELKCEELFRWREKRHLLEQKKLNEILILIEMILQFLPMRTGMNYG